MKTKMNFRILAALSVFLLAPVLVQAQTDQKAAVLKNLETGVATAKAKVAVNERKLAVADSLITAGTKLIAESKTETKAIDADSKKLEKEYAANQKPLTKLSTSKDKAAATKAKADLKALTLQYKTDSKAVETRIKDATKMSTIGNAALTKGKAAKKSAQDALKASQAALKTVQAKYDAASGSGENTNPKGKTKR
jgi:chromosome segregation ATPase